MITNYEMGKRISRMVERENTMYELINLAIDNFNTRIGLLSAFDDAQSAPDGIHRLNQIILDLEKYRDTFRELEPRWSDTITAAEQAMVNLRRQS